MLLLEIGGEGYFAPFFEFGSEGVEFGGGSLVGEGAEEEVEGGIFAGDGVDDGFCAAGGVTSLGAVVFFW